LKEKQRTNINIIKNDMNFKVGIFVLSIIILGGLFIPFLGFIRGKGLFHLLFFLLMLFIMMFWIYYFTSRPKKFGFSEESLYLKYRNDSKEIMWDEIKKLNLSTNNIDQKIPFWATIILKNGASYDIGAVNKTIARKIQKNIKD